nr:Pyridine nucleotide-disulfide oxidoreductase [uncultured organism]
MTGSPRRATVVVIGGGQAGLSAAFHLKKRGFIGASAHADPVSDLSAPADPDGRSFVVLDAAPASGGAWQHRWESLTMATVNGIFDLPGYPKPPIESDEPSRSAVPRYFAAFEESSGLPILRPVTVTSVRRVDGDPHGELLVQTDAGDWLARFVINATGTWTNPVLPRFPGADAFLGRQLHTRDYVDLTEFAGHRVAVVGGGISAVQQLEEISRVATTFWYTRREPVFLDGQFTAEDGRATIERVSADVEAGLPSGSIVSYTGLGWTPYAIAARDRGVLVRRPMFTALEPYGIREADGSFTSADVVLWATGFRAALDHLEPLELRNAHGGIALDDTEVLSEPRVHLIGFGPSQSTVGANRAGRAAAQTIAKRLSRARSVAEPSA